MKILSSLAASALVLASTSADYVSTLRQIPTPYDYQMRPVRMIQARAQLDAPVWNETYQMFTSRYGGDNFEEKFRAAMDTVNTASVEGSLMYVQAECINELERGREDRCKRKNDVKYMVFYDIVFANTNETLAEYPEGEVGPMVPMDGGWCTPDKEDKDKGIIEFSKFCKYFNGVDGEPEIGPFVGGEFKGTDARAPYPGNYWFSFPNTDPMKIWKKKTEEARSETRRGLCEHDVMPNGVDCTFNYRILGYVAIDDLVGITNMTYENGTNYAGFEEFCEDGGIEFQAEENGTFIKGIEFWKDPEDEVANVERINKLLELYEAFAGVGSSSQIPDEFVAQMKPLPTVESLVAINPPCYENIESCERGCVRQNFSQICVKCSPGTEGCQVAPADFSFPKLERAVGEGGKTAEPTLAPTDSPTPGGGNANETPKTQDPNAAGTSLVGSAVLVASVILFSML